MEKESMKLLEKICECQAMCKYCFNACLEEENLSKMVSCIKMGIECAEICGLTISSVAYEGDFDRDMLRVCIDACERYAEECRRQDRMHCIECAKACEECARVCRAYIFRHMAFSYCEPAVAVSH